MDRAVGHDLLRAVRRLAGPLAVVAVTAGLFLALASRSGDAAPARPQQTGPVDEVAFGRQLYLVGCSSCHGFGAEGVPGVAPSLTTAGAAAADFYLRTGRMPLANYKDQPTRHPPAYPDNEIRALVAYVASLGSGPPIPVLPARTDLAQGLQLFLLNCASCHNDAGAGGALGYGDVVPALRRATTLQTAEAIRVGPSPMPVFGSKTLSDQQVADIASYVQYLHHPQDRGGAGLGHLGPIPEGFVGWVVGMGLLLLIARLIGTRA
jgi:ubiquinol-cytochrome c reductase cytochrome c subunit